MRIACLGDRPDIPELHGGGLEGLERPLHKIVWMLMAVMLEHRIRDAVRCYAAQNVGADSAGMVAPGAHPTQSSAQGFLIRHENMEVEGKVAWRAKPRQVAWRAKPRRGWFPWEVKANRKVHGFDEPVEQSGHALQNPVGAVKIRSKKAKNEAFGKK